MFLVKVGFIGTVLIFWNVVFHEKGDKGKYKKFIVYLRIRTPEQLITKRKIFLFSMHCTKN